MGWAPYQNAQYVFLILVLPDLLSTKFGLVTVMQLFLRLQHCSFPSKVFLVSGRLTVIFSHERVMSRICLLAVAGLVGAGSSEPFLLSKVGSSTVKTVLSWVRVLNVRRFCRDFSIYIQVLLRNNTNFD